MQEAKYGEQDDQIGMLRLLQNKTFTDAYPLHDVCLGGGGWGWGRV